MSHLQTKFWGVRGGWPTPQRDHMAVGGNTSCVEIRFAGEEGVIVIDGGTGIVGLGESLQREFAGRPISAHILLTHFHWDHIQGFPFFAPLYDAKNRFHFYAGRPASDIAKALEGQMSQPYFPAPFEALAAHKEFVDARGREIQVGEARIRSFPVNHPQGGCGYRVEVHGAVVVHVCDHEYGDARIDAGVLENARDADVLIYDAQYLPEEYAAKRGWGHSAYVHAVSVARSCNAGQLVLFHHDPRHNDERMESILAAARQGFANTELAREGWTIAL